MSDFFLITSVRIVNDSTFMTGNFFYILHFLIIPNIMSCLFKQFLDDRFKTCFSVTENIGHGLREYCATIPLK